MCHHRVPVAETLFVQTRRLCSGCASQWLWDEDEREDEDGKK
jgi:hypothetical protein